MKINFRKVSAIAASALMVGMTMGTAFAANYPAPFIAGGAANVAVVYGTGSGVSSLDLVQAGNIQANLQSKMGGAGSSTTATGGSSWQVGTGSDKLEIGESIKDVETYIGSDDLSLLADQSISNEKGDATYQQFLYFEDTTSSFVTYTEDDEDNIGLFFKISSGQVIARYVMDFSSDLKSDIETDGELSDIEDKDITFLGKTYTIVDATNASTGVQLTLMSGALGGTINNDETLTLDGYTVKATISSASEAKFTVTTASGTETTDKMAKGGMEKLSDGNYIAVTDITYESYAGGIHAATFYIGADKIEWKNGSDMTSNGETINEAAVTITKTESSGDIDISEISINMTAEDDLYVPAKGKLSQANNLDEPQVLVSQNWDIQFEGLEAVDYEDISLKVSGSDQKYNLKFKNYNGDETDLPLVFTNESGIYGGEDNDKRFNINPNGSTTGQNITKKDYFFVHTADPCSATADAKSVLVQYKSADKPTDTNPKVTFTINPGSADAYDKDMSLSTTAATFTLKVAGGTFNFANSSTTASSDFDIALVGDDYGDGAGTANNSASMCVRTQYNTLINITDSNASSVISEIGDAVPGTRAAPWIVNVTVDDGNRDGDDFTVPANSQVFYVALGNTSTDATATFTGTTSWQTDNANSDVQKYIGRYGFDLTKTDPSDSPADIEVKVPKSIVTPLVYISTGDVQVTTTTGSATQLGDVLVKDSEVSSVSSKNLIVVGGSCINSVAANLLGSACSADFTTKTGVGTGQFLIQSIASTYSTGKIALVVAGYEAADTVNAATYLRTQTVDTTVGKKYKGTSATTAELVTTNSTA